MYAGGGGTAPSETGGGGPKGAAGNGGFGFYNKPITQPFSAPYSVGTGGDFNYADSQILFHKAFDLAEIISNIFSAPAFEVAINIIFLAMTFLPVTSEK